MFTEDLSLLRGPPGRDGRDGRVGRDCDSDELEKLVEMIFNESKKSGETSSVTDTTTGRSPLGSYDTGEVLLSYLFYS